MSTLNTYNLKSPDSANTNLALDASGNVAIQAGSASAPSIYVTGDTNTGLYSPGADQVAVATGGAARLFIDSAGRLLVGTSSTRTYAGVTPQIQLEGTSFNSSSISLTANSNDGNSAFLQFYKTRGTSVGSNTVVQSGDYLGALEFYGGDGSAPRSGASINVFVDGTPGASDMPGRLVFSTTADGASSPTERFTILQSGHFKTGTLYNRTSAVAANVYVDSDTSLYRATSSGKYKTDVETLEDTYADALLECRPVWYRSLCEGDNPNHGWWGFIAEEVAEIDPRLVHWKTTEISYDDKGSMVETPCEPEPEGVQYDRFVPHLLNLIKRQKEQIEAMEARLTALESV